MAAMRGILVKQFGGPEVLQYVKTISRPSEPVGRQVLFILIIYLGYYLNFYRIIIIMAINVVQ